MLVHLKTYWKQVLFIVGILVLLGFLTFTFTSPQGLLSGVQNDLKNIEPPETSPYTTLDGEVVELKDFKGKPLIVNSWATWAPFGQIEFPLLSKVKETYGDQVEVISINRQENKNIVKSYIRTLTIHENIVMILDPTDYFYKHIGGYAMPETVFYDKDGNVSAHKRGVLSEKELEANIAKIIE